MTDHWLCLRLNERQVVFAELNGPVVERMIRIDLVHPVAMTLDLPGKVDSVIITNTGNHVHVIVGEEAPRAWLFSKMEDVGIWAEAIVVLDGYAGWEADRLQNNQATTFEELRQYMAN